MTPPPCSGARQLTMADRNPGRRQQCWANLPAPQRRQMIRHCRDLTPSAAQIRDSLTLIGHATTAAWATRPAARQRVPLTRYRSLVRHLMYADLLRLALDAGGQREHTALLAEAITARLPTT